MRPLIICLTPVKNEAWCLDVFLKCTSLWADHIIIADQNSTDGSREIARKYSKVTLIENNNREFNEDERQKILINEARKITGDKILVALDADEIFTGNFCKTRDWERILDSKPGEVFGFQWANIAPDQKHYFPSKFYYPWLMHDDGTKHENYVRPMHSMRIPYPKSADKGYYHVNDFKVFHLAWIYKQRVTSKSRFYQCLVTVRQSDESFIALHRSYYQKKVRTYLIPSEWIEDYDKQSIDIFGMLNLAARYFWFDDKVKDYLKEYGANKFRYLDVWDKDWVNEMSSTLEIKDPRSIGIKLVHLYLRLTSQYASYFLIKGVDKILKMLLNK